VQISSMDGSARLNCCRYRSATSKHRHRVAFQFSATTAISFKYGLPGQIVATSAAFVDIEG